MQTHAQDFVKAFVKKYPTDERCNGPAERHEPDIMMVEFVLWYTENVSKHIPHDDLRFCDHDTRMVGNDNGHFVIDTDTGLIAEHYKR
jgi:beta-lactamase class D